jgi:hypothetical protein
MYTAFRISGLSATVSRADGSVNPPFIAGGLPPVLTAIVYVSDEVSSQVSVDGLSATIETNKMNAEVT